jgi:hypothetical protein
LAVSHLEKKATMKNYSLLELFHQDCMIRLFSKKSNLPFSVN